MRRNNRYAPRRLRSFHGSGLYSTKLTPQQQVATASLKEQLITDHLAGEAPTAAQQTIMSMLGHALARTNACAAYLKALGDRPPINPRTHAAWPLVRDCTLLEAHITRLLEALCDERFERRAAEVTDIATALAEAHPAPAPDADAPDDAAS